MKLSKYKNLYQLTIFPHFFPVNCYLYEEDAELTLIDTGLAASYKGILAAVNKIGKPLMNIVLTHAHGDHLGALDKLKVKFPHACVSISARDSRLMKGDRTLDINEPQNPIKGDIPKGLKTVPDRLLKEGDQIGTLEVIETPGHTPGSISLFDRDFQMIIAGDAMQTHGRVAVSGQIVPIFPFPAFGTWNKELATESVKKIIQLKPSMLAVGHGNMIEGPDNLMLQALIQAERNLVNNQKG